MSQKIKILPPEEIQKIAAGEVVERPSSVLKELIENSLDAGSSQISIYIEKSGKQKIRVVDNGCGMSRDDLAICFLPHATSKIRSIHDLETISTFGFRGEALAVISSVSKTTLVTRQASDKLGLQITVEGSQFSPIIEVASSEGCDLSVELLFFNTPARKKFLKNDETEWNNIQSYFFSFALQRIDVSFSLYRDGKKIVHAPAVATLQERVGQLFGYSLAEQCLELQSVENKNGIEINGLISHQHAWRYSRSHIFVFVNNRPVKNLGLFKTLYKGYNNSLPEGRFPLAFIFISLDPTRVDVNVHPRKEEVAFEKPLQVESILQAQVQRTLEARVSRALEAPRSSFVSAHHSASQEVKKITSPFFSFSNNEDFPLQPVSSPSITFFSKQTSEIVDAIDEIQPPKQETVFSPAITIRGVLFHTYIIVEQEHEALIIDQHAAHERVLYEQFSSNFEKREGTRLLFPEIIELSEHQTTLLLKERDFFSSQGVELDAVGTREIAITSAPPRLHNQSLSEFIKEVAAYMEENEQCAHEQFKKLLREHVHSHMACKAAVKAGDILSDVEMQELIKQLLKSPNRHICVHGRPTMWTISRSELEKRFKRKT